MWRLRAGIVLVTFAGMLIFGGVVAHGGWYWNSKIDVEGVQLRTIWEVTDQGDYVYYHTTDFQVTVPKNATATVVEQAANETVAIAHSKKLSCAADGIETTVKTKVSALEGATGSKAKITLTADGVVVAEKTGKVGRGITLNALLPTNGLAC